MPSAIEINNLQKQYKGAFTPALDGLSLKIKQGKIVGLLGPNGAGKTTSINILCGLIEQDSGTAIVFGKDCTHDKSAIRRLIGVVPQQIALFGHMTAWVNFRYI